MVAKGVHKITRAVRAVKTIQKTRLKGQNKVRAETRGAALYNQREQEATDG